MNNYLILSYSNPDEMTGEVNRKWQEGWRPQGGLFVQQGETGCIFLQAIIRPGEDPTIKNTPNKSKLRLSALLDSPPPGK